MNKTKFIIALAMAAIAFSSCRSSDQKAGPSPLKKPGPSNLADHIKPEKYELSAQDKSTLLKIARQTVESIVRDGRVPEFDISPENKLLLADGAAFVTLKKDGRLRGCIGHTIAQEPLWMCVRDVAVAAATRDPRFMPVTTAELTDIDIEVSVLTPLERVKSADELVMGRDGVVLKNGWHTGVFLPQVADETGWDRNTFLAQLCSQKAGLPQTCWQDPSTEMYSFRAIVFEEEKKEALP